MSRMLWHWGLLLALCALAGCATTQPSWSESAGDDDAGPVVSFEEACAEKSSLLALCAGKQCGLYRCREVMKHLTVGQVVRTWGEVEPLAEVGVGAQRYWGSERAGQLIYQFELFGPVMPYWQQPPSLPPGY